ncbi:hypothetical protein [Spiroplasma endosymbiont of Polydrusus formosus]
MTIYFQSMSIYEISFLTETIIESEESIWFKWNPRF